MVAILTRVFGLHNIELAEDIVQDTLQLAFEAWSPGPLPDNPAAWLMTVARRKAINVVRREKLHRQFAKDIDTLLKSEYTAAYTMDQVFLETEITDSQLRMIFTCCHPHLPTEAQVALTLKTLCGFGIADIAAALLTSESNINKRLYRAKEKIRNENIDFSVPAGNQLRPRLDAVLLVIYLLFNEGYNSAGDNAAIRKDLCLEALRLAMLLTEKPPMNEYPPVYALIALFCFHSARLDARVDDNDGLIVLEDQDRGRWDRALIDQGMHFLGRSATGDAATAYHLEAAIAAEHCLASDFAVTNWQRIHEYYTALEKLKPSSVIRLNLAIVTGKTAGPQAAIALLHELETHKALGNYYLLYASLGEMYYLAGRKEAAVDYFLQAKALTRSAAIQAVIDRKLAR